MTHDVHHEHLVTELADQLEPVLTNFPQATYLYLDDEHKTCNQKLFDMLGYSSIEEWVSNESPVGDISEEDQPKVIQAYGDASGHFKASTLSTTIIKKDRTRIETKIIMVPITCKGEVFVLRFISEEK